MKKGRREQIGKKEGREGGRKEGNSQSSPEAQRVPHSIKSKEKHTKTHINQTMKN